MCNNMCLRTQETNIKFRLKKITFATICCYSIPNFNKYYQQFSCQRQMSTKITKPKWSRKKMKMLNFIY